jgi:hypothetical protein
VSPETYSAPSDLHVSALEGWSIISAIRGDESPRYVRFRRVLVPRTFEMIVTPKTTAMSKESQPWAVSLMYEAEEDGSDIMLTGLISSLIEVDKALAELQRPLTWWKRYALTRIAYDAFDHSFDHILEQHEPPLAEDQLAGALRAFLANNVRAALSAPLAKRRNRITKDHLAEVAQIYKKAVEVGEHPTQAVAKAMNVSHSAASKYVGKARQEGLLDKTRQGVAGKRGRA